MCPVAGCRKHKDVQGLNLASGAPKVHSRRKSRLPADCTVSGTQGRVQSAARPHSLPRNDNSCWCTLLQPFSQTVLGMRCCTQAWRGIPRSGCVLGEVFRQAVLLDTPSRVTWQLCNPDGVPVSVLSPDISPHGVLFETRGSLGSKPSYTPAGDNARRSALSDAKAKLIHSTARLQASSKRDDHRKN